MSKPRLKISVYSNGVFALSGSKFVLWLLKFVRLSIDGRVPTAPFCNTGCRTTKCERTRL